MTHSGAKAKFEISSRWCKRGHDTFALGRYDSGECKECKRLAGLKRRQSIEPKAYKRYCKRGHDTWALGRDANLYCTSCRKNQNRERERMGKKRSEPDALWVIGLKELREKRGITLHALAWECRSLEPSAIHAIEEGHIEATYSERVEIFQAFNVIAGRDAEEREARRQASSRLVAAGLV